MCRNHDMRWYCIFRRKKCSDLWQYRKIARLDVKGPPELSKTSSVISPNSLHNTQGQRPYYKMKNKFSHNMQDEKRKVKTLKTLISCIIPVAN